VRPELPLAEFPGHLLSLVSSGICKADCYYRGPYQAGAVFFLIFETPLRNEPPTRAERACNVLMEAISQFDVADHRAMATAYLKAEGFDLNENANSIEATARDGRSLSLEFDSLRRLARVSSVVK
jgi:hypothetical protein